MIVDRLPETGQVVVAHPSLRLFAGVYAERHGLDLYLSDLADTKHVYTLDIDSMLDIEGVRLDG